jgi:hypothetical protein
VNKALVAVATVVVLGCTGEAQSASKRASNDPPRTVVLELFTSQGCSSCPPADKLLSKLGGEDFHRGVIVPLAYHVDYWNHLGWSDPFSSPKWSARQREYAASIQGSSVYTPQLIVNGTVQLVGSSERNVRAEIERQLQARDRGTVVIDRIVIDRTGREGNELEVQLRAELDRSTTDHRVDVVVALFENGMATAVSRGENANRNLADDYIVRWQSRAFEQAPDGTEVTAKVRIPLAAGWRADHLGVAAFEQDPKSRAILGSSARMVTVR